MTELHTPIRTYLFTGAALLLLLVATVLIGELPLGLLKPVFTLVIAGAKATLVALFFMHLKPASAITRVFAGAGLLWLSFLIALTLIDAATRGWVRPGG